MDPKYDHEEVRLGLGLGFDYSPEKREHDPQTSKKRKTFLGLSIPLNTTDDDEDEDCKSSTEYSRKKLRLTKDQITLLEENFKLHTTLNTVQKQSLAEKLNLKPRQVEVWFQNRRARTKLKKTEVDGELLKKKCERLSEENWRLKKELLELRAVMKMEKPTPQFLHHNQKAAAREKNRGGRAEEEGASTEVVVHIVDESN